MTFDRRNLKVLAADLQAAVDAVAKKHGITITLGGGRFSPTEYRTRLTASTDAPLNAEVRARKEFEEYSGQFFLKNNDFGRTFVNPYGGGSYTICGIKPRSTKYPILCQNGRGTVYKLPASQVLRGLGRQEDAKKAELQERMGLGTTIDPEIIAARRGLV